MAVRHITHADIDEESTLERQTADRAAEALPATEPIDITPLLADAESPAASADAKHDSRADSER